MKLLKTAAFLVLTSGFMSVAAAQDAPKTETVPPAEVVQAPTPTPAPKADLAAVWSKITPMLQVRTRYEYRDNYDFNRKIQKADRDNFVLLRTRVGLKAKPVDEVELFAQIQDSREFGTSKLTASPYGQGNIVRGVSPDDEGLALHQGYFKIKVPGVEGLAFQAGRQEFRLGEERLVGALDWSNRGRSFDGGIATFTHDKFQADGFWFVVVRGDAGSPAATSKSAGTASPVSALGIAEDTRLGGLNLRYDDDQIGTVEAYYLNVLDRDGGALLAFTPPAPPPKQNDLILHTAGLHLLKKPARSAVDWSLEGAVQWGQDGYLKHRAGAFHTALGFTADNDAQPRFMLEYNYATGGDDYAAHKSYAFRNLFPTNHNKYGAIDFMTWTNMHDIHPELSATINKVKLILGYHEFLAVDDNGAIGTGAGALAANAARTSRQFGRELDLMASGKLYDPVAVLVGYSAFNPGKMFRQTYAPALKTDVANFVYVQATISL